MPKRLVDGDALWKSRKLKTVDPDYRGEYANLIPLAEADGTFEASSDRVWSDVYSYNRTDWDIDSVEEMLQAFEKAGMLVRKTDENGVVWGKFVGIDSRLPSESTRSRYKQGNTNIFNNVEHVVITSRPTHDKVMTGEDGFGIGKERIGEEIGQCSFKNISTHYASFMGVAHSHNRKHVEKYQQACARYGEDRVLALFDRWAKSVGWFRDKKDSNGLNLFWKPLEEMAAGDDLSADRKRFNGLDKPIEIKDGPDPFEVEPDPDALSPEQILANRDKI